MNLCCKKYSFRRCSSRYCRSGCSDSSNRIWHKQSVRMSFTSSLNQKKHFLYNELAILRFPHSRRDFKDCTLKNLQYPKIMSYCKSISSSFSIRCWLSTEDHFIWVFLGPVVAIIVVSRDPFSRVTP